VLFQSASYFNLGELGALFGRLNPSNPPCGNWTMWENFSLLFDAIDSEKYLGYARYVKLSVYKHDRAQRIQVVSTLLHEAKSMLGLF